MSAHDAPGATLLAEVQELLGEQDVVVGPEEALELDSLRLVLVAQELEDRFGLSLRGEDLRPEHFGSPLAIARFVEARRG